MNYKVFGLNGCKKLKQLSPLHYSFSKNKYMDSLELDCLCIKFKKKTRVRRERRCKENGEMMKKATKTMTEIKKDGERLFAFVIPRFVWYSGGGLLFVCPQQFMIPCFLFRWRET